MRRDSRNVELSRRDLAQCGVPRFSRREVAKREVSRKVCKVWASQKRGCKVRGDSRSVELSRRDLAKCGVPRFSKRTVATCEISGKDFVKHGLPRSNVAKCEGVL